MRKKQWFVLEFIAVFLMFWSDSGKKYPIRYIVAGKQSNFSGSVYDCVLYNGESDTLYTRLWRLDPFVDYFVIFSSGITFSGRKKVLNFKPFEDEILDYSEKLYIVQENLSCPNEEGRSDVWCREYRQRNYLQKILKRLSPRDGDLIISSDIDEIPTRKGMNIVLNNPPKDAYRLEGITVSPNYLFYHHHWGKAVAARYKSKKMLTFEELRANSITFGDSENPIVTHCTFCFNDYESYLNKLRSYSHVEYNGYPWTNLSFIFHFHYCRHHIEKQFAAKKHHYFDDQLKDLVPDDYRLNYLINESFMLDISKTIYTSEDIHSNRICSADYDFFTTETKPFSLRTKYMI